MNDLVAYYKLFTPSNGLILLLWLVVIGVLIDQLWGFIATERAVAKDRERDGLTLSWRSRYAIFRERSDDFAEQVRRYYNRTRYGLRFLFKCAVVCTLSIETLVVCGVVVNPGLIVWAQFVSKLSLSYISAFLFYFLVVHWQRQIDKEHIQDHIGPLLQDIIHEAVSMSEPVARFFSTEDAPTDVFRLTRIQIGEALRSYDGNDVLPNTSLDGHPTTVQGIVLHHVDRTKEHMQELLLHYTLLEGELVSILSVLRSQRLLKDDHAFLDRMKPSYLGEGLWTYLRCVVVLARYADHYPGRKAKMAPYGESDARTRERLGDNWHEELGIKHDPDIHWKVRRLLRRKGKGNRA